MKLNNENKKNTTLKYLDLGWNEISDEVAKKISDLLKEKENFIEVLF